VKATGLLSGAVAVGGYAFTTVLLIAGFTSGQWPFPGGDVVDYYAAAGDALRSGGQVYGTEYLFLYAPPWAVAFGAVSWLGAGAIHGIILALDAVALWAIAGGNPRRLGHLLWFPLIAFEIAAGQLNLLVAAAIVVAQRGTTWPLAAMTLAKVFPALALPPRHWRRFAVELLAISLVTLPWLYLWPQWVATLVEIGTNPRGPVVPVPWIARAVIAGLLLLARRAWCRALAAAIVSPTLYWGQLVIFAAPLVLWLDRRELDERPSPAGRDRHVHSDR
jgi:hypothetical protein